MSSTEIKNEIKKILDSVPENALPSIFDYLKEIEQSIQSENTNDFLKELHLKHSDLLSKLAK
jgi:hypothetical protein